MNKSMTGLRLVFGLALLLSIFNLRAADVNPGLWDVSLTLTPDGAAPICPFNQQKCVSLTDAQNPQKLFAEAGGVDCSYDNSKVDGNHLSFSVQCGGEVPFSGQGGVTFSPDSFDGEMDVTANIPGIGDVQGKSRISGKRAGDC